MVHDSSKTARIDVGDEVTYNEEGVSQFYLTDSESEALFKVVGETRLNGERLLKLEPLHSSLDYMQDEVSETYLKKAATNSPKTRCSHRNPIAGYNPDELARDLGSIGFDFTRRDRSGSNWEMQKGSTTVEYRTPDAYGGERFVVDTGQRKSEVDDATDAYKLIVEDVLIQPGDDRIIVERMNHPDSERITLDEFIRLNSGPMMGLDSTTLEQAEKFRDARPGEKVQLGIGGGTDEWMRISTNKPTEREKATMRKRKNADFVRAIDERDLKEEILMTAKAMGEHYAAEAPDAIDDVLEQIKDRFGKMVETWRSELIRDLEDEWSQSPRKSRHASLEGMHEDLADDLDRLPFVDAHVELDNDGIPFVRISKIAGEGYYDAWFGYDSDFGHWEGRNPDLQTMAATTTVRQYEDFWKTVDKHLEGDLDLLMPEPQDFEEMRSDMGYGSTASRNRCSKCNTHMKNANKTINTSGMTAEQAANEFASELQDFGDKFGYNTSYINVLPPEENEWVNRHGGETWEVVWEDGPHEWAIHLLGGESMLYGEFPEMGVGEPEIEIRESRDVSVEPGRGFTILFYSK